MPNRPKASSSEHNKRAKSLIRTLPQVQAYRFISRENYYKERSFQHITNNNNFSDISRKTKTFALNRWRGYRNSSWVAKTDTTYQQQRRVKQKTYPRFDELSSDLSSDDSFGSDSETSRSGIEIRTSNRPIGIHQAGTPYDTVKTIEIEYLPQLPSPNIAFGFRSTPYEVAKRKNDYDAAKGGVDWQSKSQSATSMKQKYDFEQNGGGGGSNQYNDESYRFFNQTFDTQETLRTVGGCFAKDRDVIAEYIRETVTSTKLTVTRDIFKYIMPKNFQESTFPKSTAKLPETFPIGEKIISESVSKQCLPLTADIALKVRDGQKEFFDKIIKPKTIDKTTDLMKIVDFPKTNDVTLSNVEKDHETSSSNTNLPPILLTNREPNWIQQARLPFAKAPSPTEPGREPCMVSPDQARPSELSMREPSAMAPSPTEPGRKPSAREPSACAIEPAKIESGREHSASQAVPFPKADILSTSTTKTGSSDSPTIIFRPTIVVIQNVFTLPATLLAQLHNLPGGIQSLVTLQNQELFVFPNSVQVSSLNSAYPVSSQSTNSSDDSPLLKFLNNRPPSHSSKRSLSPPTAHTSRKKIL